jgi:hypothetical protein
MSLATPQRPQGICDTSGYVTFWSAGRRSMAAVQRTPACLDVKGFNSGRRERSVLRLVLAQTA